MNLKNDTSSLLMAFYIWFPGFFFYSSLVASGVLSSFSIGYFLPASFFVFVLLSYFYLIKNSKFNWCIFDFVFFFFLAVLLLLVCANYFFSYNRFASELFFWSSSGLISNLLLYLVARQVCFDGRNSRAVCTLLLCMVLFILLNLDGSGRFSPISESVDSDVVTTYQGFGRSFAAVALVAISFSRGNIYFLLFSLFSLLALYVNSARTEFFCFFAVFFIFVSIRFGVLRSLLFFLSVVVLSYFFILDVYPDFFGLHVQESRIFELFSGNSTSLGARLEIQDYAIGLIERNPIVGNYGDYTALGGIGFYPHNLLSAWVNFGLFGFLGYVLLLLWMFSGIFRYWRLYLRRDGYYLCFLGFYSFTVIAFFAATDYSYVFFAIAAGMYSRLYRQLRIKY